LSPDGHLLAGVVHVPSEPDERTWWTRLLEWVGLGEAKRTWDIKLMETDSGREVFTWKNASIARFSPDGQLLAVVLRNGTLQLFDLPLARPWLRIVSLAMLSALLAFLVLKACIWLRNKVPFRKGCIVSSTVAGQGT